MRIRKKHFFWSISIFVVSAAGLASCAKTGSSYTVSPVTYVSLMNVAPYSPAADVYLNGQLATTSGGIASGSYSLKYGALQPGSYSITFKKTGTTDSLTAIPGTNRLDTLNFYTLIMYNDTTPAHGAQSMLIHDDFTNISTTNANYRFFNLSPDAPNVNFYLTDGMPATYPGRTTGDNVVYQNYNAFQSTAPATYSFVVKSAVGDSSTPVATLPNQSLMGGNVYTIFLTGVKGSYKLNLLPASY
ncbi:MAG: DUF4397 domain-containing protein [Bacteroidetes bacterium]|nr:DUF4397 domain-containing protein [Bacteroidota bacterium]